MPKTTRKNNRIKLAAPVRSASLAHQVYEKIRNEIITCVLEPGQPVTQAQLVEKFQVGVTPVREALQRLAQDGLVQAVPRFGYVVAPITLADIQALYEFRNVLECAAIRLAAKHATDPQLEQIARAARFKYTFRDRQSYSEFLNRNAEFHRSIALASGNPRLAAAIFAVLIELTRVFHLGLDLRDSAQEMYDEHRALAEALQARAAEKAAQIFTSQNARSEARVREALTRNTRDNTLDALSKTMRFR
jgi:DNA-binding GntR family transcriptional regulator